MVGVGGIEPPRCPRHERSTGAPRSIAARVPRHTRLRTVPSPAPAGISFRSLPRGCTAGMDLAVRVRAMRAESPGNRPISTLGTPPANRRLPQASLPVAAGSKSREYSEREVAYERPARCAHPNLACRGAGWHGRRDLRRAGNGESSSGAVECDPGCARQLRPQYSDGVSNLAIRGQSFHERTKSIR